MGWLLLANVALLASCRSFDPEPVLVNRLPDTFVIGAPAETTGSIFRRHMYWYGVDADGRVTRFIWAVTDTLIPDDEDPDLDERDVLFDPADDITTTNPREHVEVGYTTRTDSVFLFTVGLGPTLSKEITFHIVAVDDRGGIDETPARLRFFDNSLGNPTIQFRVFTLDGPAGAEQLRWEGGTGGPTIGSPEQTLQPFVGYRQPFRVEWSASSPNGPIAGYRFKASESTSADFLPPEDPVTGEKVFGDARAFTYANDVPEASISEECDTGEDCPELKRWETGPHQLTVVAIDVAAVESPEVDGELIFQSNYPPQTRLVLDDSYPQYRLRNEFDNFVRFEEGDTIPADSYAIFRMAGFDRLPTTPGLGDSFCCDQPIAEAPFELGFQGRTRFQMATDGGTIVTRSDGFSRAVAQDTLGFVVGPFSYVFEGRAQDQHRRPDLTPALFKFVAGFLPRILEVQPSTGSELLLKDPLVAGRWPDNTVEYSVGPFPENLYWDGLQYVADGTPQQARSVWRFRYSLRFAGRSDPREPEQGIRSWAYELRSDGDPRNVEIDGAGSDRLSEFDTPETVDVWEQNDAVEILVPLEIFFSPWDYDAEGERADEGLKLRRSLGAMSLSVQGKTTGASSSFEHYPATLRPEGAPSSIDLSDKGRRSSIRQETFRARIGIDRSADGQQDGQIDCYWPDPVPCPRER